MIVVIGGSGQLGSDICRELEQNYEIKKLEHENFCVERPQDVYSTLLELEPEIIINTAAYHNVNLCERYPKKAFLINGIALKYLSDVCNNIDSTLVHFSTDYVFGGERERRIPYVETDKTAPLQIYGVSKVAGEQIIEAYCKRYFILRISGLYGIHGTSAKKYPNFVEMMISLGNKAKDSMPSAKDQRLTFNHTVEIAKVVKKLVETDEYGLYHATCEGDSSRLEFTQEIFNLMGINTELKGVNSEYFDPNYEQPSYSVLENKKLKKLGIEMPHWKDALKDYIRVRRE